MEEPLAKKLLEGKLKQQHISENRATWFLLDIEKELAWATNATFRGLTLKDQGDGFLLVIRATKSKKPVVAFIGARTVLQCLEILASMAYYDQLEWKPDKYAK